MLIPIQTPDGAVIREAEEEEILRNRHHFRLVFNRRKHLKLAVTKIRNIPITSLGKKGTSFRQELPIGRVWALREIEGSR